MAESPTDLDSFVAALAPAVRNALADAVDLERRLDALMRAGRAAWPKVALATSVFYAFIGARLDEADRLDRLPAADLYLACAWLSGDAEAVEALESGPFKEAARLLSRFNAPEHLVEEAKQSARSLLFARAGGRAALASYGGQGPLRTWLGILLARELLALLRQDKKTERAHPSELLAIADGNDDPETLYLRSYYSEQFRRAFTDALWSLPVDDKRVLRYHIVERLTIDQAAALMGVHRATAARHINGARERLLDEARALLRERLQIDSAELQSLQRLVERDFDVSVRRLLTTDAERP